MTIDKIGCWIMGSAIVAWAILLAYKLIVFGKIELEILK